MSKVLRAASEALTAIIVTLAIMVGAFSAMFGFDELIALSGIYYAVWAAAILVTHLGLARSRRHVRLSVSVAVGVVVMGTHLVMFLTGNIPVAMNLVPVILHDFGLALVAMTVLNIVHLVIFRRRQPKQGAVPGPNAAERVDGVPSPQEQSFEDAVEASVDPGPDAEHEDSSSLSA
jgi:hypothetical protein